MSIIPEALDRFTDEEKELNDLIGTVDDQVLTNYLLKRQLFAEMTKKEQDHINDIYEQGTTHFSVNLHDHEIQMKLLTNKDRSAIDREIDTIFYGDKKSKYNSNDLQDNAIAQYRILATIASAIVTFDGETWDVMFKENMPNSAIEDSIFNKVSMLESMSPALTSSIFEKYSDFEARIYGLFQFESIRKK